MRGTFEVKYERPTGGRAKVCCWFNCIRCVKGLGLLEELHEGGVTLLGGDGEGCFALEVHGGYVCAFFDEELAEGDVAFYGGEHEERPALVVGGVGAEAGDEGGAEAFFVAALDEVLCASVVDGSAPRRCAAGVYLTRALFAGRASGLCRAS